MENLHKVMVIGAGLGLHSQIAAMFPEQKPAKALTERDKAALSKAEAKRQRRQQRNKRAGGGEVSLFQCYQCGCRENTATCNFWSNMEGNWRGLEPQPWMLCSACDPAIGKWHDHFPRRFLPKGMFITNERGNLAHKETGEENTEPYAIPASTAHQQQEAAHHEQ